MRKNRKMPKKMSVVAGLSVKIGAVMVMLFAWGILYVLATSSCTQLSTTIISMKTPNPATQVVRMDASGRPYSGQISVARARERSKAAQTAKYTPARNPAAGMASNRRRR